MAGATVRKLMVEVVEAKNLLPKDGTGTSSPYVIVDFDGQRKRTQTIPRDLNPAWNEVLAFDLISSGNEIMGEMLEVDVYHDKKVGPSRRSNFLGRVRLDSRQFVNKGEEALIHFPLEKKSFFSWIRGEIGLKIYYVDEPVPAPEPEKAEEAPAEVAPAEGGGETEKVEATVVAQQAEGDAAKQEEQTPVAEANPPESEAPAPSPAGDAQNPQEQVEAESPAPAPENTENTMQQPAEEAPAPAPAPAPATVADPVQEATQPQVRAVPRQKPKAPEPIERSTFDLVDKMQYLFVRVVRARSLPNGAKPHVRITASGRQACTTVARRVGKLSEWNQTFAFARDPAVADDSSMIEVSVWDLPPDAHVDDGDDRHFLGGLCFDVSDIPKRDPPDSTLAPQWYALEGRWARSGDLMLSTWIGTQADEWFREAWKADGSSRQGSGSKVYQSPKLWYLRATIIELQDAVLAAREISISFRATLGFQIQRTRYSISRNGTAPSWNEDLIFVAAEPFDEDQRLILQMETRNGKETIVLGSAVIPLSSVERRVDDRKVASRWLDLIPADEKRRRSFGGRLHIRVCLDGGYHVADEPSHAASDYRPSARQLWRPPIGSIELGIISCKGLLPMRTVDGKGTTDAFAVAKYGPKWARTRTISDNFDPAWNEQYTWEVHDPCTVLTIAVFDDSIDSTAKDSTCRPMGRLRLRISTLETNRAYRCFFPLTILLPSGLKRMGDIEIAVRFSRPGSSLDLLHLYTQPMLPAMHHARPILAAQREPLRLSAARIVAAHLSRAEPSLKKEVVVWVLEAEPKVFSMRRVRANWQRIVASLTWLADVAKWMDEIRRWRNPTATVMVHMVIILIAWYPDLIVPVIGVHVAGIGMVRYRKRVRGPEGPVLGIEGGVIDRDELDEEWDPVPSTKAAEVVRVRYDKMRVVGSRVQGMLGDVAAQVERVQALVSWKDPRATGMFVGACLVVSMVVFLVPARVVGVVVGFYWLRHPMFRDRMPPAALNFFRRLPALSDRIV
ncbi:Phosphoribosyltransferase C-terminal protein [Dioscorea alata]|uniref:Phosphoribosyltransferase C-terminal protein n=1 Tax=Dioscorea alata TaxID=55571 RepID=A0ACB7UM46_DIOAL|nr:Phosphoribosyltransferase C-terminal protein [Dioscorea alata]